MTVKDPTNTRQRIDYIDMPGGGVKAVLTISLPGGVVKRFETLVTPEDALAVQGQIAGVSAYPLDAGCGCGVRPGDVGWNPFKAIAKAAKAVASSKVFALAATGLALAAPLLGPIAPAALGAAAAMGIAGKLAKAGHAAAQGAKDVAKILTSDAANDARKLTSTAAGAAKLLAVANSKRLGAEKIAAAKPAAKQPKPKAAAKPKPAPKLGAVKAGSPATVDIVAAARAGRVRSNQKGVINPQQLMAAHQAGRVFWVMAS